jgi:AcrR family transcriptional regulator
MELDLTCEMGYHWCIDATASTPQPFDAPPTGLRERARRAIQDEVGDIAMRLFLDQGFDETTVEQVCTAAGLSRSSFFRYFPTKEDVVLETVAAHSHQIAEALLRRPDSETPWVALRNAFESQVQVLTDNKDWYLRLTRLVTQTASVRARQYEKTLVWQALLVPAIARRLGLSDTDATDPRPAALVGSAVSCFQAATEAWTEVDGAVSMSTLVDLAMGAVSSGGLDAER